MCVIHDLTPRAYARGVVSSDIQPPTQAVSGNSLGIGYYHGTYWNPQLPQVNTSPGWVWTTCRMDPQCQHRTQRPLPAHGGLDPPANQWPSTSPSGGAARSFVALSTGPSGFFVFHTSTVSFSDSFSAIHPPVSCLLSFLVCCGVLKTPFVSD